MLSTPPAFVLSQDQTLNKVVSYGTYRPLKPFYRAFWLFLLPQIFWLLVCISTSFSQIYLRFRISPLEPLTLSNFQGPGAIRPRLPAHNPVSTFTYRSRCRVCKSLPALAGPYFAHHTTGAFTYPSRFRVCVGFYTVRPFGPAYSRTTQRARLRTARASAFVSLCRRFRCQLN